MLFINREYCENQDPEIVKEVVSESVARIRKIIDHTRDRLCLDAFCKFTQR